MPDSPSVPVVTLTKAQRAEAVVAAVTASHKAHERGAYGDNSPARHLTGRLGEVAAYEWLQLRSDGVKPLYRYSSRMREADVGIGDLGVEVKSWRERSWATYGPSLAPRQLTRIVAKSAVIMFCLVPDTGPWPETPDQVRLVGWMPAREAVSTGSPVWRAPFRADLVVSRARFRPTRTLLCYLEHLEQATTETDAVDGASSYASSRLPCGHEGVLGHCWVCRGGVEQPDWVLMSERGRAFHHSSVDDIRRAHDGLPFAYSSLLCRLPVGEAVLSNDPCGFCFPRREAREEPGSV